MTFSLTLSLPVLVLLGLSLMLFILVTWLCFRQGLFDGSDDMGISGLFVGALYGVIWVIPSLGMWVIYLAWVK